jgi:hypothetical protein
MPKKALQFFDLPEKRRSDSKRGNGSAKAGVYILFFFSV